MKTIVTTYKIKKGALLVIDSPSIPLHRRTQDLYYETCLTGNTDCVKITSSNASMEGTIGGNKLYITGLKPGKAVMGVYYRSRLSNDVGLRASDYIIEIEVV